MVSENAIRVIVNPSPLLMNSHDILTPGHKSMLRILLDFSAFDKVPHQRLFSKLAHYGVQGQILEWIKDFITNRSQQVVLNNTTSSSINYA